MASAVARAYIGGLWALPPAGSRGREGGAMAGLPPPGSATELKRWAEKCSRSYSTTDEVLSRPLVRRSESDFEIEAPQLGKSNRKTPITKSYPTITITEIANRRNYSSDVE